MPLWPAFGVRASAGLAILCLNVPDVRGQTSATARTEFEVASIRPVPPSEGEKRVSMTGGPGRIDYRNVTVSALIRKAYGVRIYPPSAGPDAQSTDRYDIVAKASSPASEEQTMRMLQALLEERFKLVLHHETKELRVYALVVGKNGAKLHAVQDDGSTPEIGSAEGHQIKGHHVSMKLLAETLQRFVGDPVLDTTGLTGLFDLNLDFTLDESLSATGQSVFEAVQQLGLKLEARKGPVEVVVIDHVEKPSGN